MDRRDFLYSTLASATALTAETEALAQTAGPKARNVPAFELDEATIEQLGQMQESGRRTARAVTQLYLDRIEAVNKKGPEVRAVIETNPDALADADALDRERKQKGPRGPLHGIPVLLKDNIGTADNTHTAAGSLALAGWTPKKDAFIAARLRAAGAIILGKANMSEWAYFRASNAVSGWSGRGGQTRCPYALDRNPQGSSSGSGVAVAANMSAIAVGSDTGGSIVWPASANNCVGLRPTQGLISRAGVIPLSETQDTVGPMTRTVRDTAIMLAVMAGADPDDAITSTGTGHTEKDYTQFLDPKGLRGVRLVVAREYWGIHHRLDLQMEKNLEVLRKEGAILIDHNEGLTASAFGADMREVFLYDFKANLNDYLQQTPADFPVRSLKDVIEFNEKNRVLEMPYFEQDLMIKAEAKGPRTDQRYKDARARCLRLARTEGIDAALTKNNAVAIVAPTLTPPCLIDWISGDGRMNGCSTIGTVAGYPHLCVPGGFVQGLPVGFSFFGPAWSEPLLLKLGYAFEQITKHRSKPGFLPTVDFLA
jgi:amidase